MDLSTIMTLLGSAETVKSVSKSTKTTQKDVSSVLTAALPALLSGASKQSSGSTASSFAKALLDHSEDDTSDVPAFLNGVDLDDGAKIVTHLLGKNGAAKVAKESGVSEAKTGTILSSVAPLLMSLLGQETTAKSSSANTDVLVSVAGALLKNVDLGSLLSGLGNLVSTNTAEPKTTKKATTTKKTTTAKATTAKAATTKKATTSTKSTTTAKKATTTTAKKTTAAKKTTTKADTAANTDTLETVATLLTKLLK